MEYLSAGNFSIRLGDFQEISIDPQEVQKSELSDHPMFYWYCYPEIYQRLGEGIIIILFPSSRIEPYEDFEIIGKGMRDGIVILTRLAWRNIPVYIHEIAHTLGAKEYSEIRFWLDGLRHFYEVEKDIMDIPPQGGDIYLALSIFNRRRIGWPEVEPLLLASNN